MPQPNIHYYRVTYQFTTRYGTPVYDDITLVGRNGQGVVLLANIVLPDVDRVVDVRLIQCED
jgi:hypothetical protein